MRIEQVEKIAAELGRNTCRVVTTIELVAARVDMSVVAALVRTGRWTVLWRGVYFCSAGPVSSVVRAHAAMLSSRSDSRSW